MRPFSHLYFTFNFSLFSTISSDLGVWILEALPLDNTDDSDTAPDLFPPAAETGNLHLDSGAALMSLAMDLDGRRARPTLCCPKEEGVPCDKAWSLASVSAC